MNNSKIISIFSKQKLLYDKMKFSLCKKYKISKTSFDIIMVLYNNEDIKTAEEICFYNSLKSAIVSLQIDKLKKSEFLISTIDINDRRKNILTLTPKSYPIIQEGIRIQQRYYDKVMLNIKHKDIEIYCSFLEKMIDNIENNKCEFEV